MPSPYLPVVVLLAMVAPVTADTLVSPRSQPLREVSHTVDVRVVDGVASYVVQRQFENRGTTADEVILTIDLPSGAAATGLRIRAKQKWHAGELLERETAERRYGELTGRGMFDPKDPALLFWVASNQLQLQVFPVLPRSVSTVEYTLTVPTEYRDGRYQLTYPRAASVAKDSPDVRLLDPTITVRDTDAIVIDGKPRGRRVTLTARDPSNPDDALASFALAPPRIATWQARLGRVVASDSHAFARLEVELASQISQLPRNAQVVFVVDASHSAAATIEAQLAIVWAYAQHVPDAQVELVTYRRTASRVFGRFVPASTLAVALRDASKRGAFAPGNGSALDEGARLAGAALAKRTGPRRIVLLTDELIRSTLAPDAALQALATLDPAIVVHVVTPSLDAGETALSRDDDAPLAPLATRHHGVFARLAIEGGAPELARAVLELVRPIRIDHLAHGLHGLALADSLREGEGVRLFEAMARDDAPTSVELTGQLWSDPVRLPIAEDTTFSRATASFVFGEGLHEQLTEMEMMVVALLGRAVSPVTSYLAIEPGVRPSRIGLDRGGVGWGTIGSGSYGTLGGGSSGVAGRRRPDLSTMIDTSACLNTHAPSPGWSVKLEIETTHDEIVDVRVRNGFGAMADCLVEAAWRVRLDQRFFVEREVFVVDLM